MASLVVHINCPGDLIILFREQMPRKKWNSFLHNKLPMNLIYCHRLISREVWHSISERFRLPRLPTRALMVVMIFMVWVLVKSAAD